MRRNRIKFAIIAIAMMASLGCSFNSINIGVARTGPLQTKSVSIPAEDTDKVRVTISMRAGDLDIDGGAQELLEAEFTYNVEEWTPEVAYTITDGTGRLTVRQPNTDQLSINSNMRNKWDLRFSENLPLDMRIEGGAGRQEIDLAGLNITDLNIRLGAGDTEIDLSDNPTLQRFDLNIGAGETRIDLNGPWDQDTDVDIRGGVGKMVLLLPRDVGVRVDVSRGVGELETHNLHREDGAWVNAAYGKSDTTLQIGVQAGIGSIELDVPN